MPHASSRARSVAEGKPWVDAHHGHVAQALLRTVHNVEDDTPRAVGGADIARPQTGIQHGEGEAIEVISGWQLPPSRP